MRRRAIVADRRPETVTAPSAGDPEANAIHELYRAAVVADAAYSRVLSDHGATRWESLAIRAGRCARTQWLIKEAYTAKVNADEAYRKACRAEGTGY